MLALMMKFLLVIKMFPGIKLCKSNTIRSQYAKVDLCTRMCKIYYITGNLTGLVKGYKFHL